MEMWICFVVVFVCSCSCFSVSGECAFPFVGDGVADSVVDSVQTVVDLLKLLFERCRRFALFVLLQVVYLGLIEVGRE